MPRHNSKFLTIFILCLVFLLILNALWFHWLPHTAFASSAVSKLFTSTGRLNVLASAVIRWRHLESDNESLRSQLASEISDKADIARLQKENDQLKSAAGLASKVKKSVIPAGIFDISLAPDGYTALVNKGTNQDVAVGDILVGDHNVLLGVVRQVFSSSARVTLVSDPSFKVTVQVLGGTAKGIAKGTLDKGMVLDLIIQSDEIKQGDTLISSGDDMFPAGLVVGAVSSVQTNSAKLFKEVTVSPAAQFMAGNAYIIK